MSPPFSCFRSTEYFQNRDKIYLVDGEFHDALKANILGGPNDLFESRLLLQNITKIRPDEFGDKAKPFVHGIGYDMNG